MEEIFVQVVGMGKSAEVTAMNWKNLFTVYLRKLRDRGTIILTIIITAIVMSVLLFGMGKIVSKVRTTACEEVPLVMAGLWPVYGIGPLHIMLVQ